MPSSSAARISKVPLGTEISNPSMVTVTRSSFAGEFWTAVTRSPPASGAFGAEWRDVSRHSREIAPLAGSRAWSGGAAASVGSGQHAGPGEGAATTGDVRAVLVVEVLDRGRHRAGRAVPERAERAAQDVVGQVEERVDVRHRRGAV